MKQALKGILCLMAVGFLLVGCAKEAGSVNAEAMGLEEVPVINILAFSASPSITCSVQPPEVESINYATALTRWNGASFKRPDIFSPDILGDRYENPIPIRLDTPLDRYRTDVKIDFGEHPPSEIQFKQVVLVKEGEGYTADYSNALELSILAPEQDDHVNNASVPFGKGGTYGWYEGALIIYPAALVSVEDTTENHLYGFSLVTTWGENVSEYGFLLKPPEPYKVPAE